MSKNKKLIGIVTRKIESGSELIFCVWNPSSPLKEYKFPLGKSITTNFFKAGEWVEFIPKRYVDELQDEKDIQRVTDRDKLGLLPKVVTMLPTLENKAGFKVDVNISFPPNGFEQYKAQLDESKVHGCRVIGWCWEFKSVAVAHDGVSFEPGKFYSGQAIRIDPSLDFIAQKMGTLWVLCPGSQLKELNDTKFLEQLRLQVPWKHLLVTNVITAASGSFCSSNSIASDSSSSTCELQHNDAFLLIDDDDDGWSSDCKSDVTVRADHVDDTLQQQQPTHTGIGADGIDHESMLFGNLIEHKLEWIGKRSPSAVLYLQKSIMELCKDYESRLLNSDNNNNRPAQHDINFGVDVHHLSNLFG